MTIRFGLLDGDRAWSSNSNSSLQELTGIPLEQTRIDHPFRRIADWSAYFPTLRVVKQLVFKGHKTFLLRDRPASSSPRSMFVDAESGLLVPEAFLPTIPGLGEVGVRIEYEDWRDVAGIKLPFRVVVEYATPLLRTTTSVYEKFETNVEAAEDSFRLAK